LRARDLADARGAPV